MDSQWNNWHFAKFASQEPDAFAWQIAPMFVILALIITIIPLYAVLPIKEQLRKLALHQNKVVFLSWQIVIGSLLALCIWSTHFLLMVGIRLPTPSLTLSMILAIVVASANYSLFFNFACLPQLKRQQYYLWLMTNTITLLCLQATLIIPITGNNHFSLNSYPIFIATIFFIAISLMMLELLNSEDSEQTIFSTKSALLCIFIGIFSLLAIE
jgi:NO-binding membrane sensor protein with MHYT domain